MHKGESSRSGCVLLCGLIVIWAGTGCLRCPKRCEPDLHAVAPALEEPMPPEPAPLTPDPTKVLTLQLQQISEQHEGQTALDRHSNRFTRWLDCIHQRTFCCMDNLIRRADTMWLSERMMYDYQLSTFALRTETRYGGRSNKKEFESKVRFRVDAALPGLEERLRLFLDNSGRNELPGSDSLKQEDDTRLGIKTVWDTYFHNQLDLSTGLRFSDSKPVVFADLEWEWKREMGRWQVRLTPSAFWYSNDGLGQMTELVWTRPLEGRKILQFRTAESSGEDKVGVEFEQSLRFAWLRSGRGRGWVMQMSVFPNIEYSELLLDDALVSLSWRDALYRKWIYYTITPQVDFPREDDYHPRPSIRIGLEMLFGGQIGNLM